MAENTAFQLVTKTDGYRAVNHVLKVVIDYVRYLGLAIFIVFGPE